MSSSRTAPPAFAQLVDCTCGTIHRAGIVHRDIKPSNVLVTRRAESSCWTSAWQRIGVDATRSAPGRDPGYMAPEQALGQTPTPASDWYSVGVMLYETLTGVLPFTGTALDILLAKQRPDLIADAQP